MRLYGVDWTGPISDDEDFSCVEVPHTRCLLQNAEYMQLQAVVSPTDFSENYGIDLYIRCLSFVCHTLRQ